MPVFAIPITMPCYTMWEFDFPSGTRLCSEVGVNSATAGAYLPVIKSSGSYRVGLTEGSLQHTVLNPVLADPTESILNLIGKGERWQNSAARAYWAPANATGKSQWTQMFGGVIDDMQPAGRGEWRLTVMPRLRELRSPFPIQQVSIYDFPNADKTALGNQIPNVLGLQDDYGDQNTGAVPTLYVDKTSNFYYLVSAGQRKVRRVYSAGVLKTETTHYTILYSTIGGRLYTLIHFLTDQTTNQVTCDVEGPDTVGDGTGTMVTEATDVLRFVLENFVYSEYQGGNWLTNWSTNPGSGVSATGAPINTASFATVRAQLSGRAGGSAFAAARYLAGQTTGEQFVNEWSSSTGVDVVWDQKGNLALYYDECYSNDAGYSDPILRYPGDFGPDGLQLALDSKGCVSTGIIQYEAFASEPAVTSPQGIHSKLRKHKPDPTNRDGKGYYQLQVEDPLSTVQASVNLTAACGPATTP